MVVCAPEHKPLLVVVLMALILGCISPTSCDKPYIHIGGDCCLDADDDRICDSDEGKAEATSSTEPPEKPGGGIGIGPEPRISTKGYSEGYNYAQGGMITGVSISVEVTNAGGAGDVFVSVHSLNSGNYNASKLFHMGEGESVVVKAYFSVSPKRYFLHRFNWTARAASSGDTSEGDVTVEPKTQ